MRPAVVLLHGFTNTGRSWLPVADRLRERYTAVSPDLPGHGSATATRPAAVDKWAGHVIAAAPAEPFTLAGYSMGGRLALHVALAHPERVAALVLIGATPGIADPVERAARAQEDERLAAEIEAAPIDEFARRWARQPIFKGQSQEVAAAAHEDRLRNQPAGLAWALRALGQGALEPLWSRLGELEMPVTLIAGERDAKYRKVAERMEAAMPTAELLVVPATGHAVHLEAPQIVADAIARAASLAEQRC